MNLCHRKQESLMKDLKNLLNSCKPLSGRVSLGGGAITRDWLDA